MNRQRGVIAVMYLWIAGGIAVTIIGLGIAVKIQSSRLESCKNDFATFKAEVHALGVAAEKAARAKELADKQAKEVADREYSKTKGDLAKSYAAYRKLRDSNAGSGGMPPAAPVTSGTDRTCFDSAKFAGAMGVLEAGVPNITEQGDAAKSRLVGAMRWATSLKAN